MAERSELTKRVLPQMTLSSSANPLTAPLRRSADPTPAGRAAARFRVAGVAIVTGGGGGLGFTASEALLEHGLECAEVGCAGDGRRRGRGLTAAARTGDRAARGGGRLAGSLSGRLRDRRRRGRTGSLRLRRIERWCATAAPDGRGWIDSTHRVRPFSRQAASFGPCHL